MFSHMKKTLAAAVFCLTAVVLGAALSAVPAAAAGYSDIEGHWAQERIERWSDSGILSGYVDGTFRPNGQISRAELSSILFRLLKLEPIDHHYHYADLTPDKWYYESLSTMHTLGAALNTGDRMYPEQSLTREEAVYMIAKSFFVGEDRADRSNLTGVPDGGAIQDRFSSRVGKMMAEGYISGYPDGSFGPGQPITRAEIITIIDGIIDQYIASPGEYTLSGGQTALVACGNAALTGTGDSTVYLVGEGAQGSTALRGSSSFDVYAVSREKAAWKAEGGCAIQERGALVLRELTLPDLKFEGGTGQFASPYVISTPDQLASLGYATIYETDAYYCLDRDIDMGELDGPVGWRNPNCAMVWLDGGGHTVTYRMNHSSTRGPDFGLFSAWYGECSNLTLAGTVNVTFRPDGSSFKPSAFEFTYGGWAGEQRGGAYRNVRCTLDLAVNGGDAQHMYVGGLTGMAYDVVFEGCTFAGSARSVFVGTDGVETHLNLGGLSGWSRNAVFTDCVSEGSVQGTFQGPGTVRSELTTGGLVGRAVSTTLTRCFFSGTAETVAQDSENQSGVGGLVGNGYDRMRFTGCGATGTVSAQGGQHSSAGGLTAFLAFTYERDSYEKPNPGEPDFEEKVGVIQGCWSTAAISAFGASFQSDCGGLAGQLSPAILRASWASPRITLESPSYQNAGGIAGSAYYGSTVENCWANARGCASGGQLHSGGIVGRLSDSAVSSCYALGTGKFSLEDAIVFASWNDGTVTGCVDAGRASRAERNRVCQSWSSSGLWDLGQEYPILRDMDRTSQLAAQK